MLKSSAIFVGSQLTAATQFTSALPRPNSCERLMACADCE